MIRQLSLFFLTLATLFMSGCGTARPVPALQQAKTLPAWYFNPPANTEAYLYGIGEGENLDDATKQALESLIARLGISISSSYASKTHVNKGYREYFEKHTTSDIQTEISKIRISNYEVMQNHQQRYNHFIVLLRSDRSVFTASLKQEVKRTFERARTKRVQLKSSDILTRHHFYKEATQELEGRLPTLLVINTLDPSFDDTPYLATIAKTGEEYDLLKSKLTFSIHADDDGTKFADLIQTALTKRSMRLVNAEKSDENTLLVELKVSVVPVRSHGFDIARVALSIEIREHHGKVIGGNRLNITGQATQGIDIAVENALKKLDSKIRSDGISEVLGLDIAI